MFHTVSRVPAVAFYTFESNHSTMSGQPPVVPPTLSYKSKAEREREERERKELERQEAERLEQER